VERRWGREGGGTEEEGGRGEGGEGGKGGGEIGKGKEGRGEMGGRGMDEMKTEGGGGEDRDREEVTQKIWE